MRRLLVLPFLFAIPLQAADSAKSQEFFEMRVRPLLAGNCLACHSASKMGGLEMKSRESLLKGGNSGAAAIPGDPDHSLLLRVVRHQHERIKMPPTGKLKDEDIETLAAWVRDGVVWPEGAVKQSAAPAQAKYVISPEQRAFWAFRPVRKPELPTVRDSKWARSPVDRFVLAELEKKGLKPVKPADKRTLLRRATYDLTGLPPGPEEVDAFLKDNSADAFVKVVDRLLASPHYGERWGRHWLDVARYSDDKLDPTGETPHPNSFRYRDWAIQAFNEDMPYDLFVKAQIAGDLLPEPGKTAAGLGLYALSPEFQDDRVDVTTRGFLGLTVACAQCHDHKYDPIPTTDYYALLGIFSNTRLGEYPTASAEVVADWKARKKRVDDAEKQWKDFAKAQADQLSLVLASRTADYLMAARGGPAAGLDAETLEKWTKYLSASEREHPFLNRWNNQGADAKARKFAEDFQVQALAVYAEKKSVDEQNLIRLGSSPDRRALSQADLVSLERDKYFLWRDLFGERRGVYYFDEKSIGRFLTGVWSEHLKALENTVAALKKELPPQYPYLQVIQDVEAPRVQRVQVRGDRNNLGDEVPARFISILCEGAPKKFTKGTGRLELAESIADPKNPLTSRVMANRIWQAHFGDAIVRTPSNFGQLGERPTHPELLDYLAARFVENKWSVKAMHREIMLSATYQLSSAHSRYNESVDPDNRLLWRANRKKLGAEELRDSLLFVSGELDKSAGGKAERLTPENRKRTVYGYVSRKKLDPMLALFDFPNPNTTSEQRITTNVPLQSLFFLNSPLMLKQSEALAARIEQGDFREAYRRIFGRDPSRQEIRMGEQYLRETKENAWQKYLQVLLSSNEFIYIS